MILLVGSLVLITVNLVRFSSAAVASARHGETVGSGENQAVMELSDGVVRTVKYVVVPAALLLLGGVLIRGGRDDDRLHGLRVETGED
ncbi:MAG TPA: hypothetical protein DCY13_23310 [Verrucomicrobiales bacterium]|nr:hypothetical protein [Verrucomicrobiales bacterium]